VDLTCIMLVLKKITKKLTVKPVVHYDKISSIRVNILSKITCLAVRQARTDGTVGLKSYNAQRVS